jgi:hypothetical protein
MTKNVSLTKLLRFQVLTTSNMKMAVFWVVAPCSLVEVYRRFRGAYCSIIKAMMMKAASTSVQLSRRQSSSSSGRCLGFHNFTSNWLWNWKMHFQVSSVLWYFRIYTGTCDSITRRTYSRRGSKLLACSTCVIKSDPNMQLCSCATS